MAQTKHSLQILVTPTDYGKLQQLAKLRNLSMGAIVREMIKHTFYHTVERVPTCANGQSCFVPHMHTYRPEPAAPSALLRQPEVSPQTAPHYSESRPPETGP